MLRTDTSSLDFTDRLFLAVAYCNKRYEDRDQFLSDSDLLDAADAWTTDPAYTDEDTANDDPSTWPSRDDYEVLVESLYAIMTSSSDYDD